MHKCMNVMFVYTDALKGEGKLCAILFWILRFNS